MVESWVLSDLGLRRHWHSVIQLTEKCRAMEDPVLHREVGRELDGQHVVCGVAGGGEDSSTSTRLVQRTNVGSSVFDVLLLG